MRRTFMGRLLSLCMLIGIGIAVAGFASDSLLDKFFVSSVETSATISRIEESSIIPDYHTVYVTHEVAGVSYEGRIAFYDEEMQVGDVIIVSYNPEKPESIRTSDQYSTAYKMLSWGLVIAVVSLILNIFRAIARKKREERKMEKKILKKQAEQKNREENDEDDDY